MKMEAEIREETKEYLGLPEVRRGKKVLFPTHFRKIKTYQQLKF